MLHPVLDLTCRFNRPVFGNETYDSVVDEPDNIRQVFANVSIDKTHGKQPKVRTKSLHGAIDRHTFRTLRNHFIG